MKAEFCILDERFLLEGPTGVVQPIVAAYARFLVAPPVCDPPGPTTELRIDGVRVPTFEGVDWEFRAYQAFVTAIQQRTGPAALLHGAALAPPGGGVVALSGPSGFGKSSLTLALLDRGWRFLSDDFFPLDLSTGMVAPFPRRIALLREHSIPWPEPFRRAAAALEIDRLSEKVLLDPGAVLGEEVVVKEPLPLIRVVLLTDDIDRSPADPIHHRTCITATVAAGTKVRECVSRLDGAQLLEEYETGGLMSLILEFSPGRGAVAALHPLLADSGIFAVEPIDGATPAFGGSPQFRSISRTEAATGLLREMLNRLEGGRLLRERGGQLPRLFLDLAAALNRASCWLVEPGPLEATAQLITELD